MTNPRRCRHCGGWRRPDRDHRLEDRRGYALHLVNYTNPAAEKGVFRRHYAIGPQKVRMTLPSDAPVKKASLLRAESDLPFTQKGRVVEFIIPGLRDYEVAALTV